MGLRRDWVCHARDPGLLNDSRAGATNAAPNDGCGGCGGMRGDGDGHRAYEVDRPRSPEVDRPIDDAFGAKPAASVVRRRNGSPGPTVAKRRESRVTRA